MCCKGWGKQVRCCRHNGHSKKHSYQPAGKGREKEEQGTKKKMKGGVERKPGGHHAAPVLAESAVAAAQTQLSTLSSAAGYCTHSAWEKHHMAVPQCPQLALQPPSFSHRWKQVWEVIQDCEWAENRVKWRYGTMKVCRSGTVSLFLCLC